MTIETEQLCFGYGRQPAVSDVSLKLTSGVFYGILGPNGCGKTTLVDLLIRHRTPDAGVITYQGKPLAKYSRKQIARRFALVPQQYAVKHAGFEFQGHVADSRLSAIAEADLFRVNRHEFHPSAVSGKYSRKKDLR